MLNKCSKYVFLSSYEAFSEGPIVPGLGLGAGEGTTFILKAENISLSTFVNTYTYIQVSSSIYWAFTMCLMLCCILFHLILPETMS